MKRGPCQTIASGKARPTRGKRCAIVDVAPPLVGGAARAAGGMESRSIGSPRGATRYRPRVQGFEGPRKLKHAARVGIVLVRTLALTSVLAGPVAAQSGDGYEMKRSKVAGGGGTTTGGGYNLRGTMGEHDAGKMIGGGYTLIGGFSALPLPPVPPELPADANHHARKHRYLSIDPSTNAPNEVALKVEVAEMKRCSGDLERACTVDDDCEASVPGSGTCVQHADVGLSWWVQAPQQEQLGCIPGPCGDEDWFARVDATPYFDTWTLNTLHIGDCEVIPVATYGVRACLAPDGIVCSEPVTVGTIRQPEIAPGFRGNSGDVVGPVEGTDSDLHFTPPDGFTNVVDVSAYVLTKQNYGTASKPQAHPTWIDLHGLGDGNPPQYILNVSDLGLILKALVGDAWTDDPGNMNPGACP